MRDHRILIIIKPAFLFVFLLSASLSAGEAGDLARSFPLPLPEAERVLTEWLTESGFRIRQSTSRSDRILLEATRGNESWHIVLRPQSPLASSVQAEYTRNGRPEASRVEPLFAYLEAYSGGLAPARDKTGREIPLLVLSQAGAAVLIKGRVGKEVLQFSGFVVDRKGWILSTAHDLTGIQALVVILGSGQELEARLVKRDPRKDLSLIGVESRLPSSVDVAGGRNLLPEGEPVFAICYTEAGEKRIFSGAISAPLRKVNDLPMWQVDMETVPGCSGSPVFDGRGRFVSVVKGRYRGTETIGFSIPRETVLEFLREK
jgi:serine protease Do